jgi:hypothetical protein
LAAGFAVTTKLENMPHTDNGIWNLVQGNNVEWCSSVGSIDWIFGDVMFALVPASLITKGGMRLFRIDGTSSMEHCVPQRCTSDHGVDSRAKPQHQQLTSAWSCGLA